MNDLTLPEKSELRALECVIESGLKTFVDVGLALVKIRDGRMYRAEHGTFEAYCQERWGMSRNYANKMIASAVAVESLGTTVPKPETERVARPLTRLPPEKQSEAWEAANEKADKEKRTVTAKDVEAAVVESEQPRRRIERKEKKEVHVPAPLVRALHSLHVEIDLAMRKGMKEEQRAVVRKALNELINEMEG